jgi:Domain of unknown function (DUF5666)
MSRNSVHFYEVVALALVIPLAACSKNDAGSPVAPSSLPSTSIPGNSIFGATISGTVLTGANRPASVGALSMPASKATLTVSVVGTSVTSTVDGAAHFTLLNVPSGDLTLAITGSGIDARVPIAGVHANDQIVVTVTVNGTTAELDEAEHDTDNHDAEIEGSVASTSCAANPQTIVIGTIDPTTVNIQNAQIRREGDTISCAQIQVGDRIEAHGTKSGTMLVASDVNVKTDHTVPDQPGDDGSQPGHDDNTDETDESEVHGIVAGAAAGHACPAFTFSVGATTVTTTSTTKFEDTTCTGVVNGETVEVKGTRTSSAAITATKVEKD